MIKINKQTNEILYYGRLYTVKKGVDDENDTGWLQPSMTEIRTASERQTGELQKEKV